MKPANDPKLSLFVSTMLKLSGKVERLQREWSEGELYYTIAVIEAAASRAKQRMDEMKMGE